MTHDSDPRASRGLRPSIAEACRRQIAEELEGSSVDGGCDHVAGCSFCQDRMRAAAVLAEACRARPTAAAISSDELLAGIYDRVTDAAENGPVGQWLRDGLAVDGLAVDGLAGDAAQRDGVSDRAVPDSVESPLAGEPGHIELGDGVLSDGVLSDGVLGEIVRGDAEAMRRLMPVAHEPDAETWSEVRRSILDDIAAGRVAAGRVADSVRVGSDPSRALRVPGWRTLLFGAAASAAIGLTLTIAGGSSDGPAEAPRIVFVDLERPPTNEYTLARNTLARNGDVR